MVKITNGKDVIEVTQGAFDGIYSKQGYKVFKDAAVPVEAEEPGNTGKTEDELFVEELLTKPIAQWNKDEVKRFAELKEIDLKDTKNINEAKELVKMFIEAGAGE